MDEEKPRRIGLSHMEQILEFPVGTIISHSGGGTLADRLFVVTGHWIDNLMCDSVPPRDSDPNYFAEIDKITIVKEIINDIP